MNDQCLHPETELRYRRSNRAIQRQCLTCGAATTPATPHSQFTVEQLATMPDWDIKLLDMYWEKRRIARVNEVERRTHTDRLKCEQANQQVFHSLPSHYGTTEFRSRLEARWAGYFDLIGLEWQYEPEGYALPQGNYCPDFWCGQPDFGFFVEVKPDAAGLAAVKDKLLSLAKLSGQSVYCMVGPPSINPQWHASPDGESMPGVFCRYAFTDKSWGVPYFTHDALEFLEDEDEWKRAAALRFENGRAPSFI